MSRTTTISEFRAHLAERNLVAARLAALLVAVLMPAGVVLDWLTNPELVQPFFTLRVAAAAGSLVVLGLTYVVRDERVTFPLGLLPALIGSLAIAAMIGRLEGFSSPYYAGLNLCILGMGIVFVWRILQTTLACLAITSFWLVPALASGSSVWEDPAFFNNLYFLLLTSVIAVASNEVRYRQVRREHEARTSLARTSAQLEEALSQLKELDRTKTEFFTNISHELRTPLTLILTPVEDRLARDGLSADERSFFDVVRRNAYRLLRLIDDLLDLSRIDAGRLRLRVAPVDLRLLAEHSLAAFRPAAESRDIELELTTAQVENTFGDAHRLEIVLTNLLGNALKFTPDGGRIRLEVSSSDTEATVSVTDSGPGIPEADRERIFERFFRSESGGNHRVQGGAGIGLSLARQLVELHGGRLEISGGSGEGTTFTMTLLLGREHFRPEVVERRQVAVDVADGRRAGDMQLPPGSEPTLPEAGPAPEAAPIRLEDGRRPRLVLVEDNDEIREMVQRILAPSFDVEVANDGVAGLELVRSSRPDLVISDVMMPRLTGTALCASLKADPALQNIPVILLTARSGSEAVLEGYAHGADDFVTKPIHPRVLIARVRAQLRLRSLGLTLAAQAKLAAVGTLAAGIGHEVRNPVNAVVNGARALLERQNLEPSTRRVLEVIEEAGSRIDAISAALLDHSHPGEQDRPRPCDLRSGLDATVRLLEHRLNGIEVHRRYESSRPVIASAGELNQVFLNLIDNALRSTARNVWVHVADAGANVRVVVEDDGPGIPAGVAERIFDPFFTTREPGIGTGLGLYLSRKITTRYGGDLRYEGRPGGGARFHVELPAEEAE
ncbi:ATP-binding protein [Vulgatibacter incomptus]|uniref:histidine kinase n=1 Tax=Vulgatibacter incomptus TaxID=1391653 RepID=A0A0K1PIC6_9BACT|nr:ATP-binding protein [Vulgatibacter incomptus]AKU93293.1 hypothetical protein AKJ08_3680 [Vulgatibacter incomptus]